MAKKLFQLKITLNGCHVKIWRRVIVPANIKLDELHNVIQDVMGWKDCHLHEFTILGIHYGVPDPEDFHEVLSEKNVRLKELVRPICNKFKYLYDFGDDWKHTIEVESFDYKDDSGQRVFCLGGKGSCPPEDVGCPDGYENFCKAINNTSHPYHKEMKRWVYNLCFYPKDTIWPDAFNIDKVNTLLAAYDKN